MLRLISVNATNKMLCMRRCSVTSCLLWVPLTLHLNPKPQALSIASPPPHAGFVAGERADALSKMPQEEPIRHFLRQLDTIFGTHSNPKPATTCFVSGTVFDWSKEQYVGGAYTYPTLGAEPGDREALQAPVQGTLFFAGEACHAGVNPCMQAALETGELAAEQAQAALQPALSRL